VVAVTTFAGLGGVIVTVIRRRWVTRVVAVLAALSFVVAGGQRWGWGPSDLYEGTSGHAAMAEHAAFSLG